MAGMDEPEDPQDDVAENDPRSFANKPLPWRLGTIAAGPLMNLALAIMIFCGLFRAGDGAAHNYLCGAALRGLPSGLQPGDEFVEING